ncbi:unnamed protein product [Rhizoctonia solani]|uniref:CHAT domain-containing protein n=1 Tax=Rhizoctonia solani TaxID=456999 RepID=A0A8H2XSN4_9AGAM|nr:unnamed protein product [Rhizoctonia solani]
MSREEISFLFDSGVSILNQAKSNPHSPNYGDSLAEAKHYLDKVVDLTERDDPSFGSYVSTWAGVHVLCLALIDYSPELDSYLASSPLVKTLNTWFRDEGEQPREDLHVDDQELEDFWAGISQIQNDRCSSLDNPALLSPRSLAASVDALDEAILRSRSASSLCVWNLCCSVVLYLRMDVYNPSEISRCISSVARAAASGNTREILPSEDMDPSLLKAIDHILHNPQIEFRQNSLRSLVAFYAQRQLSMFNKLWGSYQTDQDTSSTDLDDAISASFEGILWTQDIGISTTVRFELISGYANAAYERFNIAQRLEDLEDSVHLLQEVQSYSRVVNDKMAAVKQLHAAMSADLAYMLSESQKLEDWEKSITYWRQSVLLTELDALDLAGRLFELGNLAFKLSRAYEDWKPEYILEAQEAYERAASVTDDPSFLARIHFELASILYHRFHYTGMRADSENGMSAGTTACDLVRQTPSLVQSDPYVYWSGVYAHCIRLMRFIQENFKQDDMTITERLGQVIELLELILPHPHPSRLMAMNRLGLSYTLLARVQRRGGQSTTIYSASLEKGMELHEAALKETQPDDYLLTVRQTFVGQTYYQLSDLPGIDEVTRLKQLDLSIEYFHRARLGGKHNMNNTLRLVTALKDRYKSLKQRSDLNECVSLLFEDGFRFGHPTVFLDAATQLVEICHEHNLHDMVIPAYERVFKALRSMTQLGLSSTERQEAIVYSVGRACDAAASALKNNRASVAIELLEEGRNLFFSQLLPIQMDTTPIKPQDPDLASYLDETLEKIKRFHRVTDSKSYQAIHVNFEGGSADEIDAVLRDHSPESQQLLHWGKELERCLNEVRKLPGLNDFMSPKPFSYLKRAAQHCPVVYLNISRFRCDALVIGSRQEGSEILVVPLPTTAAKVLALSQTMRRTIAQQGRGVRDETPEDDTRAMVQRGIKRQTPGQEVESVLRQSWDTIVRPVLLALGYLRSGSVHSSGSLPHICWCPSGPSAIFLPLHAAGDYTRGPEHWAMTHVVSTYTSTLSSLLRSLERESRTDVHDARMLLISQPASPPHLPLPGVVVERDRILATFDEIKGSGYVTSLHNEAGSVEEVVKQLPLHEMLHLACHGVQDMVDPLNSRVLLHDGPLTIREIIKTPLSKAELVYLSACQTATGSISTPDESFSLAGSLLFAGYKGAVATMWSINDQDGCDVATSFYKHILQRDGSPVENAAFALHRAVQELLEANPGIGPIRWIPFVYFGIPGASSGNTN